MLLLVTILLVVVGSISLVIGFWQSSLLPIYISIGCSVLAAAVLLIFSRKTARSHQGDSAPVSLDIGPVQHERTESVPAFSDTGRHGFASSESFAPEPTYGAAVDEGADDDFPDDDFPIERYDTRRVGEILPLLAELDLDELDLVREREEQGKGRATVLARIDQLIDRLEAEDRQEAAHRFDSDETDTGARFAEEAVDASGEGVAEPAVPTRSTQAVSVVALAEDDGYFPIEDYDDLQAGEILPLLPELDDDELVMVRDRERSLAARPSILRRIDAQLGVDAAPEPEPEPEPEPVVVAPILEPSPIAATAPVKRVPAKRAPAAKKAAPRKEQPKRSPAPVARKVPVAKAPAPVKAAARKSTPAAPAKVPAATSARKATAAKVPTARKEPAEKVTAARSTAARSTAARSTAARGAAAVPKPAKTTRKTTAKG